MPRKQFTSVGSMTLVAMHTLHVELQGDLKSGAYLNLAKVNSSGIPSDFNCDPPRIKLMERNSTNRWNTGCHPQHHVDQSYVTYFFIRFWKLLVISFQMKNLPIKHCQKCLPKQ